MLICQVYPKGPNFRECPGVYSEYVHWNMAWNGQDIFHCFGQPLMCWWVHAGLMVNALMLNKWMEWGYLWVFHGISSLDKVRCEYKGISLAAMKQAKPLKICVVSNGFSTCACHYSFNTMTSKPFFWGIDQEQDKYSKTSKKT